MSKTVIVALPRVDDKVYKISSEKVPHLTLAFLGDQVGGEQLAEVVTYVQHAASQLSPFGLTVDYRGTLGADAADVLFFENGPFDAERIKDFRHYLLLNDTIRKMYDSVEQFPEWTPHLTLGFPETPANEDDSDYPGINYVSFDRIAVWFGNYEGPEFRLKYDDHALDSAAWTAMSPDEAAKQLFHFGVKGMKWGVRKGEVSGPMAPAKERGSFKRGATKANVALQAGAKVVEDGEKKLIFLPQKNRNKAAAVTQTRVLGLAAEINNSAQFKGKDLKTDPALRDAYFKKVEKAAKDIYAEELHLARTEAWGDFFGVDTSSTRAQMRITGAAKPIKHAADGVVEEGEVLLELNFKFNELGQISDVTVPEKFLEHDDQGHDLELFHFGVKGMRWGVRRKLNPGSGEGNSGGHDASLSKRQRKKDDKWRYKVNFAGPGPWKQTAKYVNREDIKAINAKPEYKNLNFTKPSPELTKYENEINHVWAKAMTDYSAKRHGATNPSKTKRLVWSWNESSESYSSTMVPVSVKHADDEFEPATFLLNDENGYIVGFVIGEETVEHSDLDEVLAHYGVKGMRWGVTTKDRAAQRTPNPVTVSQKKPGTYAKAKGGENHPLHPDAAVALEARQKAKSSKTDALSNKELRAAVERMQLEQRYNELEFKNDRRSRGARFVAGLFGKSRYGGKDLKFEDADEKIGEQIRDAIKDAHAKKVNS